MQKLARGRTVKLDQVGSFVTCPGTGNLGVFIRYSTGGSKSLSELSAGRSFRLQLLGLHTSANHYQHSHANSTHSLRTASAPERAASMGMHNCLGSGTEIQANKRYPVPTAWAQCRT